MKHLAGIALVATLGALGAALLSTASGLAGPPPSTAATPTASVAATTGQRPLVFSDDFETFGDLSQWSGGDNALHVQQEVVSGGAYAARGTSEGSVPAYARKRLSRAYPELYYRLRFNIIDQGETPLTVLSFSTARTTPILTLSVGRTGLLGFDNVVAGKTVESSTVVTRGNWHEIQVQLQTGGANGRVEVWLDGISVGTLNFTGWLGTNPIGQIQLGDNSAGHVYDVVFDDIAVDTEFIPPSRAADPAEGTLTVRAIPPWPGMRFTIDGQTFATDHQGVARIDVKRWSPNLRERISVSPAVGADGGHATFTGWFNWIGVRDRDVDAAFNVSYPVHWTFVDLQGRPVDPRLVTSLTVKSSTGVVTTFTGDQLRRPQLLVASSIVPAPGGRHAKPLTWRIERVIVRGSNVVHESQQKFTVTPNGKPWQIKLLFYAARFTARDAFFGFPLGTAIKVEYPNGDIVVTPLGENAEATLPSLPRGQYKVSVTGAGYSPPRPLALSRDADVQLEVVSHLDIAVAVLLVAGTALTLLLIGRPRFLAPLRALNPRRLPVRWLRLSCLLLGAALLFSACRPPVSAAPPPSPAAARSVPVFAYYYIWYTPASWDRAKRDYPVLGRYSSDDASVMRQHIRWAKQAGLTGFIVSWKDTPTLDSRLATLIQIASQEHFDLAINYESLDVNRDPLPVDRVAADLTWFADHFASNRVFDRFGRPLVIWSGSWKYARNDIARVSMQVRPHMLLLASERNADDYNRIADLVDGNAYYWSSLNPTTFPDYPGKLRSIATAVHAQHGLWIAPAAPGFDARMIGGTQVVARRDGATLRTELAAAASSSPDAIGLISWNEFTENTHIEPSCDHGTRALTVLAPALGGTPPAAAGCDGAASPPAPATAAIGPVATPADLATGIHSDFDSSSPGNTTSSLYGSVVIGSLAMLFGVSLAVVIQRARKSGRSTLSPQPPGERGSKRDQQ